MKKGVKQLITGFQRSGAGDMSTPRIDIKIRENNVCYIRATGTIKKQDVFIGFQEVVELLKQYPIESIIWDFSDAMVMVFDNREVAEVAHLVKENDSKLVHSKTALVVDEALNWDVASLYEHHTSGQLSHEVKLFYSLEEAEQWVSGP